MKGNANAILSPKVIFRISPLSRHTSTLSFYSMDLFGSSVGSLTSLAFFKYPIYPRRREANFNSFYMKNAKDYVTLLNLEFLQQSAVAGL